MGVPEPHDFAVRDGAARQTALSRPPPPAPRVVTIAIRRSCRDRMRGTMLLICPTAQPDGMRHIGTTGSKELSAARSSQRRKPEDTVHAVAGNDFKSERPTALSKRERGDASLANLVFRLEMPSSEAAQSTPYQRSLRLPRPALQARISSEPSRGRDREPPMAPLGGRSNVG